MAVTAQLPDTWRGKRTIEMEWIKVEEILHASAWDGTGWADTEHHGVCIKRGIHKSGLTHIQCHNDLYIYELLITYSCLDLKLYWLQSKESPNFHCVNPFRVSGTGDRFFVGWFLGDQMFSTSHKLQLNVVCGCGSNHKERRIRTQGKPGWQLTRKRGLRWL